MNTAIITLLRDKTRVCNVINYINSIVQEENYNDVNIFPAIDKKDTTKLDMLKKQYNCSMNGGPAGCALSHMLIMESFLKTDNKYQIIIEDDFKIIKPLPKNNNEIEELIKEINVDPDNLDILYLSGRVHGDHKHRVDNGCGTEGYILTRHGAEKIFTLLKNKCDAPIDLKMQAHFAVAWKSDWCKNVYDALRSESDKIIINSYKSKTVHVLLNNYDSAILCKKTVTLDEDIQFTLTTNEVPHKSAYMRLPPNYKINYAWYGDWGSQPKTSIKGKEVTESVQTIYGDGSKDVTIHVSNELFEDPAPKHIKKLYVELSYAWF